jgi:N-acetylglucosamine-6-sulfatase
MPLHADVLLQYNTLVRRVAGVLVVCLLVLWLPDTLPQTARPAVAAPKPNIVVILTDDQTIGTLQKMPHVLRLVRRGMSFDRAVVSNALCCPSRATLLTGLYAGHTGVWTNGDGGLRWGGWPAFRRNGLNDNGTAFNGTGNNEGRTLALYLHDAGYRTGLFGKYLNHYAVADGAPPIPQGWSTWHSFVGGNGDYYGYLSSDNGVLHHHGTTARDYSTNVFGRQARAFLQAPSIQNGTQPFFLYYTPFAPHGSIVPAPRDRRVRAPTSFETPAYNERNVHDKPPYVRRTDLLTPHEHERMTAAWDRVYGTLRSVDRWIGRFERVLPDAVRRRTVFVFTSDNGQAWGDHRLTFKVDPYERSVRVPLVIAGPGIVHGATNLPTVNADLMPTILDLAGLHGVGGPYDGRSLVPVLHGTGTLSRTAVLIEHLTMHQIPSYCGVRTRGWKYVVYRTGFQELYNLDRDPYELSNVAGRRPKIRRQLRARALLLCQPRPPDW